MKLTRLLILLFVFMIFGCNNSFVIKTNTEKPDVGQLLAKPLTKKEPKPASDKAEIALRTAENAEQFSPSFALINYEIALDELQKPDDEFPGASREERISKNGITSSTLTNEIIPRVKSNAMKASEKDIFELILFINHYRRYSGLESYHKELYAITDVMKRMGQTQKAEKLMKHMLSAKQPEKLPNSRIKIRPGWEIELGESESGESQESLDDAVSKLIATSSEHLNYSDAYAKVVLSYLEKGKPQEAYDAIMLLYDRQYRQKRSMTSDIGTFTKAFEQIVENGYYDSAIGVIKTISDNWQQTYCMSSFISLLIEKGCPKESIKHADTIHEIIKESEKDDWNRKQINTPVLHELAIFYYRTGAKDKSNEIIDGFFNYLLEQKKLEKKQKDVEKAGGRLIVNTDFGNRIYEPSRGKTADIIKTLIETDQKERASKVVDARLKYITQPNIDKYMLPELYVDLLNAYLLIGDVQKANEIKGNYLTDIKIFEKDKKYICNDMLTIAGAYAKSGHKKEAEVTLNEAFKLVKETYGDADPSKIDNAIGSYLSDVADYDIAFEIAAFLDKKSSYHEKIAEQMVGRLIRDNKLERAIMKIDLVKFGDYWNLKIKNIAQKYIDRGELEKALELAKLMKDDNPGSYVMSYIYDVHLKVANEYARRGELEKAMELTSLVDKRWPREGKYNVATILLNYLDAQKLSSEEQQSLINRVLPDILQYDYELSLVDTYQPGISDKSLLELAKKAENDILSTALYLAKANWGSSSFTAEALTGYASGLIELNMHDEARQVLDEAYISWQEHPEHGPTYGNLLGIAYLWIKLGDNNKAIKLIDEASTMKGTDYYGRTDVIITIPLAYRDAGAMDKAEKFINGLSSMGHLYWHEEYQNIEVNAKIAKALWMAENGEFDKAWDSISKIELDHNQKISRDKIPRIALSKGNYEKAIELIYKTDDIYSITRGLRNVVNYLIKTNREFDFNLLLDPSITKISDIKDYKTKANAYAIVAEIYHEAGNQIKARKLLDEALDCAEKITNGKSVDTMNHLVKTLISCGFYDQALTLASERQGEYNYGERIHESIAKDCARHHNFKQAFESLNKLECLSDPKEVYGTIADHLIEAKEYDTAFELYKNSHEYFIELMCKTHGDKWYMDYEGFQDFPRRFAEGGRFDLAVKSLAYFHRPEVVKPITDVIVEMKKTNYELTENDRFVLRQLIHTDLCYVKYPRN